MNQPALESGGRGLRSVSDAQLAQDVIDVTLDGRLTDTQANTDFFVALSLYDQFQHFLLAAGQVGARHALGKPLSNSRGNMPRSSMYRSNCSFEFLEEHVLQ